MVGALGSSGGVCGLSFLPSFFLVFFEEQGAVAAAPFSSSPVGDAAAGSPTPPRRHESRPAVVVDPALEGVLRARR